MKGEENSDEYQRNKRGPKFEAIFVDCKCPKVRF